jgi:hypothetical protein
MTNNKWRVVVNLHGRNDEITEMVYLSSGDKWAAMQNVMAAFDSDESDPEWVTIDKITITKL